MLEGPSANISISKRKLQLCLDKGRKLSKTYTTSFAHQLKSMENWLLTVISNLKGSQLPSVAIVQIFPSKSPQGNGKVNLQHDYPIPTRTMTEACETGTEN